MTKPQVNALKTVLVFGYGALPNIKIFGQRKSLTHKNTSHRLTTPLFLIHLLIGRLDMF